MHLIMYKDGRRLTFDRRIFKNVINKSNRSDDSSKLFRSFGLHIKKITNFQIHSDVSPFNFSGESKESDR